MKIIKFTFPYPKFPVTRQTPKESSQWEGYNFVMNNDDLIEADYWVVFEDLLNNEETVKCSPKNTLFITGEGTATGNYEDNFLNQFGNVLTCQNRIHHSNTHYTHTANPWFVERNFDELVNQKEVLKTKKISLICSDKQHTEGHKKRYDFCMKLKAYFGDNIDLFGRGINDFDKKIDTLKDYKYSIAIENAVEENWFTEKLYDCFLTHTIPLYYGCPNITDYFPATSFVKIDIDNFDATVYEIEKLLKDDTFYETHLDAVIEAKEKYLYQYNIYPLVVNLIKENKIELTSRKKKITLSSRTSMSKIKKMSVKKTIRNIISKIPILGNIWHYRNLGLYHESIEKKRLQQEKVSSEKYLTSNDYIQEQRCKPWFADNGDKKLSISCDILNENSIVLDFGGYEGQWTSDIYSKYNSTIYVFEPYELFAKRIQERFVKNKKIKVFNFGLSDKDVTTKLYLSDNASTMFGKEEDAVEIRLQKATDFFKEYQINSVDLIKMNIEGGEYDLLEHLIEEGFIKNIKNIKVQFHDFVIDDAKERMTNIQEKLSLTHKIVYQYEFVWEHWQIK